MLEQGYDIEAVNAQEGQFYVKRPAHIPRVTDIATSGYKEGKEDGYFVNVVLGTCDCTQWQTSSSAFPDGDSHEYCKHVIWAHKTVTGAMRLLGMIPGTYRHAEGEVPPVLVVRGDEEKEL